MGFNFVWTTPLTSLLIQCRQNSWQKVNSIPYIKHWGSCSRWPAVLSFARELREAGAKHKRGSFRISYVVVDMETKKTVDGWFVLVCWAEIDCEKAPGTKDWVADKAKPPPGGDLWLIWWVKWIKMHWTKHIRLKLGTEKNKHGPQQGGIKIHWKHNGLWKK